MNSVTHNIMREIKFRLWHRKQKEMFATDLRWGSPVHHGSGWLRAVPFGQPLINSILYDGNEIQVDPNECDIMQFTGLKDKHGVEIYEGDVLEATKYSPRFWTVEFLDGQFCGVWRMEDGTLDARDLVDRLLYDGATVHHNIYEQQKEQAA